MVPMWETAGSRTVPSFCGIKRQQRQVTAGGEASGPKSMPCSHPRHHLKPLANSSEAGVLLGLGFWGSGSMLDWLPGAGCPWVSSLLWDVNFLPSPEGVYVFTLQTPLHS